MQFLGLIAAIGLLIYIGLTFGIEAALVSATLLSGLVWGLYVWFFKPDKTDEKAQEPELVDYARSFFPIFLVVLILRSFLFEPFRIPSNSMMPTLLTGDFILVNKFTYGIRLPVLGTKIVDLGDPERGDVIVFRYPVNPRQDFIKRVVGLPGDRVGYYGKVIHINGEPVKVEGIGAYHGVGSGAEATGSLEAREQLGETEHNILVVQQAPNLPPGCMVLAQGEFVVPEGQYFVMGDNRDRSLDSRCWGTVPDDHLRGKASVVWAHIDWQAGYVAFERFGRLVH